MPEQIGKYHVLERIGRGGMGMVFKAHDPILDRPVALKVISPDVDVTDELRARFFREAQACARLSHPNVITIYDMGEHDGRLFIVMELLDGEELRHIIAKKKPLTLEDKLSVMAQLCDGLHYAHQKGIVHRDIKPGNIFLLKNGQVKILDFGIAQMATAGAGLTRTGLIMGTLRYIAPEQVRGRADARSDIYSVGTVCYELLGLRPPFATDDPIHLLEQLRTEEPTPLHGLDPTLPHELTAVVERAMRKDPAERFPDLGSMRADLEKVQRSLLEEAQRLRGRLREQVRQVRELQATLADRLGHLPEQSEIPAFDDRSGLQALRALEQEIDPRLDLLRVQVARADALGPALQRASGLVEAGQVAEAIEELEAIVAEMPEHARAMEHLRRAREEAEAQRLRERVAGLLRNAREAFEARGYARCLDILDQVTAIPPPPGATQEIEALREAVEAAVAAEEAARAAREQAEHRRAQMAQALRDAQGHAIRHASALWKEAAEMSAEGDAAFAREAYAEAGAAFELATSGYRRFEDAARAAEQRERQAADQALAQAIQDQREAEASDAPQHAEELWDASVARLAEGQAALTDGEAGRAASLLEEASALYRRARAEAETWRRERIATLLRDARAALDSGSHALCVDLLDRVAEIPLPAGAAQEVDALRRDVEAALAARQAARLLREQAERAREDMAQARRSAESHPVRYASAPWNEAEARAAEAQGAFAREAYAEAGRSFDLASAAYRRFEEAARAAALQERQAADRALAQVSQLQREAQEARASHYARELSEASATKVAKGQAALAAEEHGAAAGLFDEASALFRRALEAARAARQRERRRAEEMSEQVAQAQQSAGAMSAERIAPSAWQEAAARRRDAEAALGQEEYARAAELFGAAVALYRQAEGQVREVRQRERAQAEQARGVMLERRPPALAADAATHAAGDWSEAEAVAASAEASFAREAYAQASQAFEHASTLYRRAEALAHETLRARADAEKRREAVLAARRAADEARAPKYASEPWQAAEVIQARASSALERQAYGDAQLLFVEARRLYATATRAAGIAAEAEGRRVDAMMGDARQLLDSGDARACLRRLNALLALTPGHTGAESLRRAAELEIEKVESAARAVLPAANPPTGTLDTARAHTDPTVLTSPGPAVAEPTPASTKSAEPAATGTHRAAPRTTPTRETTAPVTQGSSPPTTSSSPTDRDATLDEAPTIITGSTASAAPAVIQGEPTLPRVAPAAAPSVQPDSSGPVTDRNYLDDDTVTLFATPKQSPAQTESVEAGPSHPQLTTARPQRLRGSIIAVGGLAAAAVAAFLYLQLSPSVDSTPPGGTGGAVEKTPETPKSTSERSAPVPPQPPLPKQPVLVKDLPPGQAVPPKPEPGPQGPPTQLNPEKPAPPSSGPQPPAIAPGRPEQPIPPQVVQAPPPSTPPAPTPPPAKPPASVGQPVPTTPPSLPPPSARRDVPPSRPGEKAAPEPATKPGPVVAAVPRNLEDATQAQRAAAGARQDAERAQAPRLAAAGFTAAQQKQAEGETLLGRRDPTAKLKFEEAQQGYRLAAQEAGRVAALQQGQQLDAERARGLVETARRAADQAAAGKYAETLLTAAQAKERQGQAALGRSDYGLAAQLFRDAQADYQRAIDQAKRAAESERSEAERRLAEQKVAQERLAALQGQTEESRKGMRTRLDQAVKAEAERLAKSAFDAAQAKQAEADALASRQSFTAAIQAYKDAAERYREAADRAQVAREARAQADAAKTQMLAEKQRASQAAPEFASAMAEEKQALASYERLAYREAAEKFSSARSLYTKAAQPPTVPPPPTSPPPPIAAPPPPARRPPPPSF